jgi:hypothetical protein
MINGDTQAEKNFEKGICGGLKKDDTQNAACAFCCAAEQR